MKVVLPTLQKRILTLLGAGLSLAVIGHSDSAVRADQTKTAPPVKSDGNLLALPEEKPIHGVTWPALSPDGKTLCFTYLGDLWTIPTIGGVANRLTVHEALDAYPRWSPDGHWIAFTSTRTGSADIFLVPSTGGAARQVTFHSSADWVTDWSPDGNRLLFYSNRDTRAFALYTIDLRTHALQKLSNDVEPLRYATWSPDGKTIAYTRSGQPWWRPWYRGSVAAGIVLEDLATRKVHTLYKSSTQQFWPLFSQDSKSVYMATIAGSSNTPNLWRIPVKGGEPRPITRYTTDAVRYPSIARDGSLLAYIWNGDIYTVEPGGGTPSRVSIIARSDDKTNNQERQVLTQGANESELSPDGKQLALVLRGNIWLIPIAGGDAKRLTDSEGNYNDITWSPDGTKLSLIADRGNQPDVYVMDIKTKALTRLTNDSDNESNPQWSPDGKWVSFAKAGGQPGLYVAPGAGDAPARRLAEGNGNNNNGTGITSHAWSPDSRWVAFSRMDRIGNRDIWTVPAVGGAAVNVTRYPGNNVTPQFTRDGRKLLFISDRNGPALVQQLPLEAPEEVVDDSARKPPADRSKDVKIDFEDIHLRAKPAMPPMGNVDDYAPASDSQRIIAHLNNQFWVIPISGGAIQQLTTGPGEPGGNIRIAPDGTRFFYLGANGTPRSMVLAGGPITIHAFRADLLFDHRAQYQQAFNEFYRHYGEGFYDSKMHGVNWKSLRDKYETQLQAVGTPEEFANLLSEMVGEVNSSHSEINPPGRPPASQTATLGISYDTDYAGPGLKVSSVLPKGPADKPASRINPGDYILSVDGTDVVMSEDYYLTMQDKAGKAVELLVNSKPSKDGARTVKIKPVSSGEWTSLEYAARIRHNQAMTDKLSDHRLAYLHIQGMDQPSLQKFERELYSDAMLKDGLVLDIRGNGGGNTHDAILQDLVKRVYGFTQPRDGERQNNPQKAWTKPIVLLIDQNSYSDAEIFPSGFRALKLGKIVGVPTPGYVIGTYGGTLIDGTSYRIPAWGWYTQDGKNLENLGIPPDILVENTPEDIAAGHDRQLEVAVETLLKDMPARTETAENKQDRVGVVSSANDNPNGGSSAVRTGSGKQTSSSAIR